MGFHENTQEILVIAGNQLNPYGGHTWAAVYLYRYPHCLASVLSDAKSFKKDPNGKRKLSRSQEPCL